MRMGSARIGVVRRTGVPVARVMLVMDTDMVAVLAGGIGVVPAAAGGSMVVPAARTMATSRPVRVVVWARLRVAVTWAVVRVRVIVSRGQMRPAARIVWPWPPLLLVALVITVLAPGEIGPHQVVPPVVER